MRHYSTYSVDNCCLVATIPCAMRPGTVPSRCSIQNVDLIQVIGRLAEVGPEQPLTFKVSL